MSISDASDPHKPLTRCAVLDQQCSRVDTVVFDIDGTLLDTTGIAHLLEDPSDNYRAFHEASLFASPHRWVLARATSYDQADLRIVLLTARSETWRRHTEIWLNRHEVPRDALLMRPADDVRPDVDMKRAAIEHLSQSHHILRAYEDRPDVLALWHELGVPTVMVPGPANQ